MRSNWRRMLLWTVSASLVAVGFFAFQAIGVRRAEAEERKEPAAVIGFPVITIDKNAEIPDLLKTLNEIRDRKAELAQAEKEIIVTIKDKLKRHSIELTQLEKELELLGVPNEKAKLPRVNRTKDSITIGVLQTPEPPIATSFPPPPNMKPMPFGK